MENIRRWIGASSETRVGTRVLTACLFTVLTAACAQVSFRVWFTPVPVTLQVFAVILSGLVLGSRWGALSQLQYLAMGAMGLPVFACFSGGPMAFAGPTAGYLIGFVLGAFLAGWVFERLQSRPKIASWCGGIGGIVGIYLFGASWLAAWLAAASRTPVHACIGSAWQLGIVPFIGIDLLKAAAASALALGGSWGQGMISAFRSNGAME